eukprot:CAMPEP_0114576960 /NCGR_PEP_ID=MMETSP0125-20121206/1678_1 /TAXON_ID=485358 ORGANISM="Aristerostoma sp., Strain ATCC 50986" /NCGR_SAMPLE_ID=MMETSP0125 /ASSEMBLY_ACC=CAM_ASM_000245 /LENGTH=45 /DNA_ID= /DNA_START= /DNA_END= /DNA_ORIENTATION=
MSAPTTGDCTAIVFGNENGYVEAFSYEEEDMIVLEKEGVDYGFLN